MLLLVLFFRLFQEAGMDNHSKYRLPVGQVLQVRQDIVLESNQLIIKRILVYFKSINVPIVVLNNTVEFSHQQGSLCISIYRTSISIFI